MPLGARVTSALRGLLAGIVAGALWWCVETGANWAAGGVVPIAIARTLAWIDVAVGGGAGLLVGMLRPAWRGAALAASLGVVYGFLRVVAPPGFGAEGVYLVIAAVAAVGVVRMGGRERDSWLTFLHVTLLIVAAAMVAALALAESHTIALRGVQLPIVIGLLPFVAVSCDRILALAVRQRGVRCTLEIALAIGCAVGWGHPLVTRPVVDTIVTAVPPPAGTPDIVLISLDTTRADHLSTYGYARETSPNLTALANEAMLFTQARSTAGWTLPGHASMLTGQYPSKHGAHLAGGWLPGQSIDGRRNVAYPLAADRVTLAEVLRDRGYSTAGFVANFSYLYRDFGIGQGFGVYDDAPGILLRVEAHTVRAARAVDPGFGVKPFRTAGDINAAALAWLDAMPQGRPAFLFLNYMEPHQPWIADPPYDEWVRAMPEADRLAQTNLYTHEVRDLAADEIDFIRANYDGQVRAMDDALGALRAALEARGRWDNTLIIVTADHGEMLGEHGLVGHMGRMLYEPLVRVPMVVKFPGASRPTGRSDVPVQLVDVMPTAAEVAGVPPLPGIDGEHLLRVTRPSFAEEDINPFLVAEYGLAYDRAIRVVYEDQWKLISTSKDERLLFDLAQDPSETQNLAATHPVRVERLARRLEARIPVRIADAATAKQVN